MRKIAIMGGSFDPVHVGHVSFVNDVLAQLPVDEAVFMPAKLQPFKLDEEPAPFYDRKEMLCLATKSEPFMSVSELENELQGVSYTYRTLREFKKMTGRDTKVYFLVGTDTFMQMDTWKESSDLLGNNSIIVAHRPGYDRDRLYAKKSEYEKKFSTEILTIENKKVDISSTQIRERIKAGKSINNLVHKDVEIYIGEKGLYKSLKKKVIW